MRKADLLLLLTCTVLFIIYFKNFVYRNLKDAVHGQLASQAEDSIIRLSGAFGTLMEMQDNFDDGLRTTKPLSDHHVKPKTTEDIKLVVSSLCHSVFSGLRMVENTEASITLNHSFIKLTEINLQHG